MRQLTEKEAIDFADRRLWEGMTSLERAIFQLQQDRLCMPFGVFRSSVEYVTGTDPGDVHLAVHRKAILTRLLSIQRGGEIAYLISHTEKFQGKEIS